jgi:transposase-like protein
MRRTYRHWTVPEKRAAVDQMEVCGHGKIAAELGISKRLLYAWRDHFRKLEKAALAATSKERALERENLRLKQALATKVLEADFFKGVLRSIEAPRRPGSGPGETAPTTGSAKSADKPA